ncbi:tyrosine-protein phosphatase [Vagococcus intermedius]|uniref:Tyrosine-protein phosphatase n=1 Tax=Vagococcus intermedius TaxID=2991418 RepID=A0AAF0CU69_9ENTE|nr:tyrosine-protein phosphatase [Vagococcus intermedius]WEG72919.1 tyrosine-protein phosphatase [Vagococcus intermedius]WEG75006.1 tyrosine-protein phosphatase [Vagococcus intermedius]
MESLINFRDMGNIPTLDGKKVVEGKLFRSGEICGLTEKDQSLFTGKYGIKKIFDFRGDSEVVLKPDDSFSDVVYYQIDIMRDSLGKTAGFDSMMSEAEAADQHMLQIYRDLVLTSSSQEGYQLFLEEIAKDNCPFIFHCFAGKDRTGFGAALLLSLLGVSEELIYEDYLETNRARKTANDQILEELRVKGLSESQLASISVMMYVKKDYLDESFQLITERYGNVINYIQNGLGISLETIEKIRALYLV